MTTPARVSRWTPLCDAPYCLARHAPDSLYCANHQPKTPVPLAVYVLNTRRHALWLACAVAAFLRWTAAAAEGDGAPHPAGPRGDATP